MDREMEKWRGIQSEEREIYVCEDRLEHQPEREREGGREREQARGEERRKGERRR